VEADDVAAFDIDLGVPAMLDARFKRQWKR
jgi:hypothetical protein